jgi:hypothetical protein
MIPERLAVVLKNARAVREVYDYVAGDDIEGDLISAQQALVRHLCQSLQMPDAWRGPRIEEGNIRLHPEKKWRVRSKNTIAIEIIFPSPVDEIDRDASVNIRVPKSWKPRERFIDKLRSIMPKAKDWVHIRDCEPDELDPEYPMGKYIRYEDYADATAFSTPRFFQAISRTVGEFLRLEAEIDGLLERAKAESGAPPKQSKGQTRPKRKPR